MNDQRLNPDQLLHQIQQQTEEEKKGRLKIYLGAAPGVGKTYEMLKDGLDTRRRGVDVVLGIGVSHGRTETQSMIEQFETIPLNSVPYRDRVFDEFNLDAALKRNPQLLLIDEMAHSNIPGLRHEKRWQDIKELLDRGINVCTTLNVQHIESLNNTISDIIRAPIHETVPDFMIEMSDTIELVDLTPEDLIIRLNEGKVYFPEQIGLARLGYFKLGNLIALRDLALQVVAKHVNAKVDSYRRDQNIEQIWPIVEKILVCVSSNKSSQKLIRAAKRLSSWLKIQWMAVYVDVPYQNDAREKRQAALQNLYFAAQLGAETRILSGMDTVSEILHLAREQNITLIMVWKSIQSKFKEFFKPPMADQLLRQSGDIDVYIMTGDQAPELYSTSRKDKETYSNLLKRLGLFSWILVWVGSVTLFCAWLYPLLSNQTLMFVYLIALLSLALWMEFWSWNFAFFASLLLYNFLFVYPYYDISWFDASGLVGWTSIYIVNYLILKLKKAINFQTETNRHHEQQSSILYHLTQRLTKVHQQRDILQTGINYLADQFQFRLVVFMPKKGDLIVQARAKTRQSINSKELGIARWVYELGQPAGWGTNTLASANAFYLPMIGSQAVIGVVKMQPILKDSYELTRENFQFLETCVHQIAVALEVAQLYENK
jgi:two-component system sensor histidine kinase KdpD